jgi:hypothetical protein
MRWRGRGGGVTVRLDSTRSGDGDGMAALGSELLDGMAGPGGAVDYSGLDLPAVDGSDSIATSQ